MWLRDGIYGNKTKTLRKLYQAHLVFFRLPFSARLNTTAAIRIVKPIRILLAGLWILTLPFVLPAQVVSSTPDSIVQATAEAQGLTRVTAADLPDDATFWLISSNGVLSPYPGLLFDPTLPMYQITDGESGSYLVDATRGQVAIDPDLLTMMSRSDAINASVEAMATNIVSLVNQMQSAMASRTMATRSGMVLAMDASGGGFLPRSRSTQTVCGWKSRITTATMPI